VDAAARARSRAWCSGEQYRRGGRLSSDLGTLVSHPGRAHLGVLSPARDSSSNIVALTPDQREQHETCVNDVPPSAGDPSPSGSGAGFAPVFP